MKNNETFKDLTRFFVGDIYYLVFLVNTKVKQFGIFLSTKNRNPNTESLIPFIPQMKSLGFLLNCLWS
jgi:hypothetical protein